MSICSVGLPGVECFLYLRKWFSGAKVMPIFVRGICSAVVSNFIRRVISQCVSIRCVIRILSFSILSAFEHFQFKIRFHYSTLMRSGILRFCDKICNLLTNFYPRNFFGSFHFLLSKSKSFYCSKSSSTIF